MATFASRRTRAPRRPRSARDARRRRAGRHGGWPRRERPGGTRRRTSNQSPLGFGREVWRRPLRGARPEQRGAERRKGGGVQRVVTPARPVPAPRLRAHLREVPAPPRGRAPALRPGRAPRGGSARQLAVERRQLVEVALAAQAQAPRAARRRRARRLVGGGDEGGGDGGGGASRESAPTDSPDASPRSFVSRSAEASESLGKCLFASASAAAAAASSAAGNGSHRPQKGPRSSSSTLAEARACITGQPRPMRRGSARSPSGDAGPGGATRGRNPTRGFRPTDSLRRHGRFLPNCRRRSLLS